MGDEHRDFGINPDVSETTTPERAIKGTLTTYLRDLQTLIQEEIPAFGCAGVKITPDQARKILPKIKLLAEQFATSPSITNSRFDLEPNSARVLTSLDHFVLDGKIGLGYIADGHDVELGHTMARSFTEAVSMLDDLLNSKIINE